MSLAKVSNLGYYSVRMTDKCNTTWPQRNLQSGSSKYLLQKNSNIDKHQVWKHFSKIPDLLCSVVLGKIMQKQIKEDSEPIPKLSALWPE